MIKNLTPHPICYRPSHDAPETEGIVFPTEGIVPRVGTVETVADPIEIRHGFFIPTVTQTTGPVEGLPEPVPGVFLIVSALVFGASDRKDLVAPDTGKGAIRDGQGHILAVTRFIRREL